MRIALVIEHYDAALGGGERLTVWLAGQLAQRGHEVHAVCRDSAADDRPAADGNGNGAGRHRFQPQEPAPGRVQVHRLGGMRLGSGLGFQIFGRAVRAWRAQHKPDIVHSMSPACAGDVYHPQAGVYAEIQAQAVASRTTRAGACFKQVMLGLCGKQRTLLALERRALQGAGEAGGAGGRGVEDGPLWIVTPGAVMTEQLVRHYGVDRRQIVELRNPGLESSAESPLEPRHDALGRARFRSQYGLAQSDRVAAFVGHDFRRKGLRHAIEVVARTTSDWKLLVAGRGKVDQYAALARGLGEGGARVLFVGPIGEIDSVYAACDALLLPTYYDPGPLAVMESLAYGLPVVSTQLMGIRELVMQHGIGTIVPSPRDVEKMARALDGLPSHGSPEQECLARRARAAGASIPPADFVQRVLGLYDAVREAKAS